MSDWQSVEHEITGEIMKTDVFVKVISSAESEAKMRKDVELAFQLFRGFDARFSRFLPASELSLFNASVGGCVSSELFMLLSQSSRWFRETNGVFDPSILPILESEGYSGSFGEAKFGVPLGHTETSGAYRFDSLSFDESALSIRKPINLRIDLGGIGKGYIVDRVADMLRKRYANFFVYAGGDIFASGRNAVEGYDFWAIDVENPLNESIVTTLLLSDRAVATSGTNRRRWMIDDQEKHHLIDSRTSRSAETDLVSVSVVADSVEEADVWAKTLCILGFNKGTKIAEEKGIPSIFIGKDGKITANRYIQKFIWKI
jgi:thiamine biosynthesis lipoprotein